MSTVSIKGIPMAKASHEKHKEKSTGKTYTVAVITVSTSRFEKYGSCESPLDCEDESGKIIIDMLEKAKHKAAYCLLKDDRFGIETALMDMLERADAAIVCGGTGLTASDVTIEAVTPMLEKVIPGFGELFRIMSYEEIGTASVLSRAMAGVVEGKVVFCIPGSPNAAKLAVSKIIIPELGHIISHIKAH
jgi:molybdenum cofactor biosynthesis protein B